MRKKLEITERELERFAGYLRREEREDSTIESYMRTARRFAAWLDGRKAHIAKNKNKQQINQ